MTSAQVAIVISAAAASVGLYAAVNAHRALRWQKKRDRARRTITIHLEVQQHIAIVPAEPSGDNAFRLHVCLRLAVSLVNDSEEAVYVRALGIGAAGGLSWTTLHGKQGAPYRADDDDVRLEPRQRFVRNLDVGDAEHKAFEDGWIARAELASGETAICEGILDPTHLRGLAAAKLVPKSPPDGQTEPRRS